MSYFPTATPALRVVDSVGAVVRGPFRFAPKYGLALTGTWLGSWDVSYAPELVGPWTNLAFEKHLRFLGYRAAIKLSFAAAECDQALGDWGLSLLQRLHGDAFASDVYAPLQFNLFEEFANPPVSSSWRAVYPTSAWNPRKLDGKSVRGFVVDLELESRSLIPIPGRWAEFRW